MDESRKQVTETIKEQSMVISLEEWLKQQHIEQLEDVVDAEGYVVELKFDRMPQNHEKFAIYNIKLCAYLDKNGKVIKLGTAICLALSYLGEGFFIKEGKKYPKQMYYLPKDTGVKSNPQENGRVLYSIKHDKIYVEKSLFQAFRTYYNDKYKSTLKLKALFDKCDNLHLIIDSETTDFYKIPPANRIFEKAQEKGKTIVKAVSAMDLYDKQSYYLFDEKKYGENLFHIKKENELVCLSRVDFVERSDNGKEFVLDNKNITPVTLKTQQIDELFKLFVQYYPDVNKKLLPWDIYDSVEIMMGFKEFLLKAEISNIDEWCEQLPTRIAANKILGIEGVPQLGLIETVPNEVKSKEKDCEEFCRIYRESICPAIDAEETVKGIQDNQIINLLICMAQGFVTVISGETGSAKGAVCDALGEKLGLCSNNKKVPDRYQIIQTSKMWETKEDFAKQYEFSEAPYHQFFSMLNYEAVQRKRREMDNMPLGVIALKDAADAPIDRYFEDFITICKKWYRVKEHSIGDSKWNIPKSMRFLMVASDEAKGILSEDMVGLAHVVEIAEPLALKESINKSAIPLKWSYRMFVNAFLGKDDPVIKPKKKLKDEYDSKYKKIYEDIIEWIDRNVRCDGRKIRKRSVTIHNAVFRYWYVAQGLFTAEELEVDKKSLIPEGILVNEDCFVSSCFEENNQRVAGIVALDYALSQRVLTYITKLKGNVEVRDVSELVEKLINNKLYICAKSLKNAIESGKVKIEDELTDESNENLIIQKCNKLYAQLLEEKRHKYSDQDELIEHICELVHQCRAADVYTRNVIVNMLICLTQGFLTVFSGKPGCGKTSISRILGESLGLTNFNELNTPTALDFKGYSNFTDRRNEIVETSRYLEVSTERGWTSKRDFIGYYNPLTEKFDKSNALLYNAFLVMDNEANNASEYTQLPCFILLDEANLSPMEYYWADFMNLCEAWRESNSIDLGGGRVFRIPETLHFIATINNDHTTEILSPRLIDRANVIDLPTGEYKKLTETTDDKIEPISWKELKSAFGCAEADAELFDENNESAKNIYLAIKEFVQDKFAVSISPRTDIAVSRYWTVAKKCFTVEDYSIKEIDLENKSEEEQLELLQGCIKIGNTRREDYANITVGKETQAMDYAIAQRVLPKLTDVSGADAFKSLVELFKMLKEENLYKSAGIIVDLLERGHDTGFYNYFR